MAHYEAMQKKRFGSTYMSTSRRAQAMRSNLFGNFHCDVPRKRKQSEDSAANVSNEPPRGELRDSPNDGSSCLKDQVLAFGVLFCVGPEQDLKRLPWVSLR